VADDLPPGYTLDPPPAAAGGDLPPGYKLDEPAISREQEIRREKLKALLTANPNPGYTERLKDQVTSGLMRPISGAMSVVGGKVGEVFGGKPATAGEYYRGGVGAEEDFIKQAQKNTPGPVGTAVDVTGSLVGGGRAVGPAVGLGKQALQSGVQGAIEGGARNAESPTSAAGGAAIGGGIGAAGSAIVGGLLDRLKRVSGAKADIGEASRGGNAQLLKHEGGDIYSRLDAAGIHYSPAETAPLAANVSQRLAAEGFNPNMHRELIPALAEIGGASGQRTTWTQLQNMRTQISDLKASDNPRLRRIAGDLGDELDGFISTAKPTMPAGSVAAGVNPARDVVEARDLWRRGSQASTVEALAEKGTRKAPDPTAKVEKNFEKYSDRFLDGKKYNPNTPDQMNLIDKIVEGSPKTAATAKGLDRWGNNLIGYGSVGTAAGLALPTLFDERGGSGATGAGVAAIAAGLGAKGGSSVLRQKLAEQSAGKVNDLLRNIVTGSTAQAPGAYVPRDALSLLLAKQDAARAAGHYGASFVNRE